MINIEEIAISAVAAEFGETATYFPAVGAVRVVTVFVRRREKVVGGLGVTQLLTDGQLIEILKSELLVEPQSGDAIQVGSAFYRVRSVRPQDQFSSLIWLLDCVPDAT